LSTSDIAIATIKFEHRSLDTVLHTLQVVLARIATGHVTVDFGLLAAALYYIDEFPERCHHPKEDGYLFQRVRRRTDEYNAVLDRLQCDHRQGNNAALSLHRALVHYQGGAASGLQVFRDAVDNYAANMREHFAAEDELLLRAPSVLSEDDWLYIAEAFAANDDPLFGANHRQEFSQLYHRIMVLAPRKLQDELRAARLPRL
jgi:hemerythrin-like domain-containing protein